MTVSCSVVWCCFLVNFFILFIILLINLIGIILSMKCEYRVMMNSHSNEAFINNLITYSFVSHRYSLEALNECFSALLLYLFFIYLLKLLINNSYACPLTEHENKQQQKK